LKRALLSRSERLHGLLSAGGEPPWAEFRREVTLPLLRGLESGQPVVEGWFCFLFLSSPAVRHLLRLQLLERLAGTGVYHDLADLPETTGSSVAALLAESLNWSGPEAACLSALVDRAISLEQLPPPTAADAMFLAVTLHGPPAGAPAAASGNHGSDLLATAGWIRQLPEPDGTGTLPSSALFREWLKIAAFRGLRRGWSRSSGRRAGLLGCLEIPSPLQPAQGSPVLPEGYGAMLIEWALACLRAWPDRERLVEENHVEIHERADALLTSARRCLARVEHADRLNAWLATGAAGLLSPPWSRHRLRTSPVGNTTLLWS
jgi:hypothetical protein